MAKHGQQLRQLLGLLAVLLFQAQLAQAIIATYCSSLNTAVGPPANISTLLSEGSCRDTCVGYSFGITQDTRCWCSNIAPGSTTSLSRCNTPCPGYPPETCGSKYADLFNYLYLGIKPKATGGGAQFGYGGGGGGGDSSTTTTTTHDTTVTKTQNAPPESITRTVPHTIYETKKTTISGSIVTSSTTIVRTHFNTIITTPPSVSSPATIPTTLTAVITVNGVTTASLTTSYITAPPSSGSAPPLTETHTGLSGGAIAGIAIGVVLGVIILGLLIYFCCCRGYRSNRADGEDGRLGRNTSVLSKAGLLRHGSARHGAGVAAGAGAVTATSATMSSNTTSRWPPRLQTDIPNVSSGGPSSAATGGTMTSRRDSRPLFVDQRLNPNAVTTHPNPSQTSVSTLHDDKDYSRPLEVRNPDPPSSRLL